MTFGACRECHRAKVKCDKAFPCSRCGRLNLECIPHVSKQGQGSKKRRRGKEASPSVENAVVSSNLQPHHYGLHHIIRSWISLAFSRRSLHLLEKASALANKYNITMDNVFLGTGLKHDWTGFQRQMDFLPDILLVPAVRQQICGPKLRLFELPTDLLAATYCDCADEQALRSRWIWVREMKCGTSRFFTSPAFERDVTPWNLIQETWLRNEHEVRDLWVPQEEHEKWAQSLVHQLSLHPTPSSVPTPTRIPRSKLFLMNQSVVDVDFIACMTIVNLDHSFFYAEYIPLRDEKPRRSQTDIDDPLMFGSIAELDWPNEQVEGWMDDILNF